MSRSNQNICVLGLGYIGLPTASMFATHGFRVFGVDTNPTVINTLRQGKIHIEEPGLATIVKAALASENLSIHEKPQPADIFIIAVPTPYRKSKGSMKADLSFVHSAVESILPFLKTGNIVILESTVPPGTTRDVLLPLLKKSKLQPGRDIGVAYCPERVIPGSALKELIGNDRIVGAIDPPWGKKVRSAYKSFVSGEIFITEPTVAEMAKLLENTYRDVNIALANQIAKICETLQINVWDVIQLANRHPRVHVHKPGPGVGGHCISVDPWFLVEKFPKGSELIRLARTINDQMPEHVVRTIERIVGPKDTAKITLLGLAYKANVDDDRESPALEVVRLLQKRRPKWRIGIYDPHVRTKNVNVTGLKDALNAADLAVILTAHDEFRFLDPDQVGTLMKKRAVFDTHNILKMERWVPSGFKVYTLGMKMPGQVAKNPRVK